MRSSTSSSEPSVSNVVNGGPNWRRFFTVAVATAVGLCAALFAFIAIVDPWDVLPLSPPLARAPISTNQRFSYGGLARDPTFDSIVVGTSTSRLLRPTTLNQTMGGSFGNLSMNAATPYEQSRILATFVATHPRIRTIVLGLDFFQWCTTPAAAAKYPKGLTQPFPEWMYGENRWRLYGHLFSLYALRETLAQLAHLVGLRPARYGSDGYANFLPDDSRYDAARVAAALGALPPRGTLMDDLRDRTDLAFPTLDILRTMLESLPPQTLKVVFFAPTFLGNRPPPGTESSQSLAACKVRVARLAGRIANAKVVDFLIDSPISRNPSNYWDPMHYRVAIADRLVADLAAVARGGTGTGETDYRVLQ